MYLEWRDVDGQVQRRTVHSDMEPLVVGRNPGSPILSRETSVSRSHAHFAVERGEGLVVEDLGSSNGTFVNNERIRRAVLHEGDVVRCGEVLEVLVLAGVAPLDDGAEPVEPTRRRKPAESPVADEDRARKVREQAERHQAAQARASDGEAAPRAQPPFEPTPARLPAGAPGPARATAPLGRGAGPAPAAHAAANPPASGPPKSAPPQGPAPAAVRHSPVPVAAAQAAPAGAAEAALAEALRRAEKAESDLRASEQRAMRYSVELEGLSDKYVRLKEHNQSMSRELERTRETMAERTGQLHDAERRLTDLEQRSKDSEQRATEAAERLAALKVRLTQKDRQLEELQRQLDQLEFDYRAAQDELESLQVSVHKDSGDTSRHEREKNLLRDVIAEKEAIIYDLKADLRDKDVEIRQVRMGVGFSDLEHEKRRLLEDFHAATRRVDELADQLAVERRAHEATRAALTEQAQTPRKPAEHDVREHPEWKARLREVERLRSEREAADAALQAAHAQVDALTTQLREAVQRQAPAPQRGAPPAALQAAMDELEALREAATAARSNASVLRRYGDLVGRNPAASAELGDAAVLLVDTAAVLQGDLAEQERRADAVQAALASLLASDNRD